MYCQSRYLRLVQRSITLHSTSGITHAASGLFSATQLSLKGKKGITSTSYGGKTSKSTAAKAKVNAASVTNAASLSATAAMRALTTNKDNNTIEVIKEDEKDEMHANNEKNDNKNYNTENGLIGKTIDEVQEENDNDVYTPVNHQFDNLTEISNGEDELHEVVNGYKTEALHEDSYANKEMEDEAMSGADVVHATQDNVKNNTCLNESDNEDTTLSQNESREIDANNNKTIDTTKVDLNALLQSETLTYTTTFGDKSCANIKTGAFTLQPTDTVSIPMNLYGITYAGKLALLLTNAARAHNFVSPIWTTEEGYAKLGVRVLHTNNDNNHHEDGDNKYRQSSNNGVASDKNNGAVTVPVNYLNGMDDESFHRKVVKLYNLQQTDFPDAATATCADIRTYASSRFNHDNNNRNNSEANIPCDICGNRFSPFIVAALRGAPRFEMLQRQCPYWLTNFDIANAGFTFTNDMEELNYIAVPQIKRLNVYSYMSNKSNMEIEAERELSEKLQVDVSSNTLYYNAIQMNEKDEIIANNASSETNGIYFANKFRPYSINGSRYSGSVAYMMRNYCRRYYFSMDEYFKVIFLTQDRLRRFEGNLLSSPRYPPEQLVQKITQRKQHTPSAEWTEHEERLYTQIMTDKEHGVVPPPLTIVIKQELVTLINAEQTDCYGQLMAYMSTRRAEKMDMYAAKNTAQQAPHP